MNGAKLGDLICIIMGCSVPRPVDGEHEVYGDIYGPGVMHGKAMQLRKTGSWCCKTSNCINDNKILVLEGDFLEGPSLKDATL